MLITQQNYCHFLTEEQNTKIDIVKKDAEKIKKYQHKETIFRYQLINDILKKTYKVDKSTATDLRSKLDRILTHKIFGYVIFATILLLIFQSIFEWASFPMDLIDMVFANLSELAKDNLPAGIFTNLIAEGIIPGIGGVLIFIPQIAILFLFIAILEETGYMSRVVFLMDKIMRRFGLSGKSIVPLISGTACAIPAIMATRNIESWKERLITILVTPFTTCSARLPVYIIIIPLVIPDGRFLGLSYQALTLMLLYVIGFSMAVLSAFILDLVMKQNRKTFFVIEMPGYKIPLFKNVAFTVIEKTKTFIFEAGKIILAISIVLWVLASYGPGENFNSAESIVKTNHTALNEVELGNEIAAFKLEHSYIGIIGKSIEPAIKPEQITKDIK